MKIAFFDTHPFEKEAFTRANRERGHAIAFIEPRLIETTAQLAHGYPCICAFVNDKLNARTFEILSAGGTRLLALRTAGFNHVDLVAAKQLGMKVVRVPEYSPYAIAEHVVALIQTLNRKTHRSYNRVREGNFSLNGLVGFDLHGKTIGIIGTGKIGKVLARIMTGFGCKVLLNDLNADSMLSDVLKCRYTNLEEIFTQADIISLHVPLTPLTRHLIDEKAFSQMKKGVMLINTGRGGLIDSRALINALKTGQVGHAGLDVYEEEEGVFFQDLSGQILSDDESYSGLLIFQMFSLQVIKVFLPTRHWPILLIQPCLMSRSLNKEYLSPILFIKRSII
ncbi:MAG TPA: 2-hydroxyacid dehydrogenase [Bacteriovoracaceae bacterium]|nr:2-hydroxyacid dehydrogenase [Bacteriovoracaceae bacterium]